MNSQCCQPQLFERSTCSLSKIISGRSAQRVAEPVFHGSSGSAATALPASSGQRVPGAWHYADSSPTPRQESQIIRSRKPSRCEPVHGSSGRAATALPASSGQPSPARVVLSQECYRCPDCALRRSPSPFRLQFILAPCIPDAPAPTRQTTPTPSAKKEANMKTETENKIQDSTKQDACLDAPKSRSASRCAMRHPVPPGSDPTWALRHKSIYPTNHSSHRCFARPVSPQTSKRAHDFHLWRNSHPSPSRN